MKTIRRAFTLLELVIVIVILGIVAKYGVELLIRAYDYYIQSLSESRFQAQSEVAVEQIANRLSYRLPGSEIVRQGSLTTFTPLASTTDDPSSTVTILEWIGLDADGWRGDGASTRPTWSGFIDVDGTIALGTGNETQLMTPESNTSRVTNAVTALLPSGTMGNMGLFFIQDTNFNVMNGLGWNAQVTDQTRTVHPVNSTVNDRLAAAVTNFSNQKIYEFYKLSWTAYALRHDRTTGELRLIYNYRPWDGQTFANGTSVVLMQNVDTFRYLSIGDAIKVQVCTRDLNLTTGAYSVCKEKTVF